jgi:nicotinamidase-related amidase
MPGSEPALPSPGQPRALLVIDVQHGLFHKSTPIYRAQALLANIDALVAAAHAAGALVVYVQHASDKVLPWGSNDWQLHPRLQPADVDLIIHKQHGDAFEATTLHEELAARGIQTVVIAGLVTHGCVKATCLGARERGYAVTLAADGHSSYSKDAARLIEEWNAKLPAAGVVVIPAAEVVF